ncbi:MAG: hypothetical protein LBQ01_06845 [Prevotellaceae bacterium]|jgi:hypothetical protein|nr:hypothetical protein [Prevotellaceae bacterium]
MANRENETHQAQIDDDEISLKDLIFKIREIWAYLLSKWVTIVIVGVLSAALGLLYSIVETPEYNATLSFSVIEKGTPGGSLASLAGQFGFNLGSSGEGVFSGNNMVELLQSRNLIEQTLLSKVNINGKDCRLIEYYRELNPPDEDDSIGRSISFPPDLDRENFSRMQDSLLYDLNRKITEDKLSVDKQKKDVNIIHVSFLNDDELFAKLFTEKLIGIVSEFYIQIKTKNIKTNLEVLEWRADSVRREYEEALLALAVFLDQNLHPSKRSGMVDQQKFQTKIQLTGTAYAELVKHVEIMKLDLAQQTPLIQIIDTPIMPLEIERLGKAKGIVLGGFLGGFLIVAWLLAVYFYRRVMQE